MDDQQYEELEDLVYIFKTVRFLEEEKVQFIKEIIDSEYDTKNISKKVKEKMRIQMIEAFEWIESLHIKPKYKDKFLSYFSN